MKMLLHIPHSSLYIPKEYLCDYKIDINQLEEYNIFMSDIYTDELFECCDYDVIKFEYSRLFCDVEKFFNPDLEVMYQYGMGPIYTKVYDGTIIRDSKQMVSKEYIKSIYERHHNKLDEYTKEVLETNESLLIIDCHSFSDKMTNTIFGTKDNPDICIGVDKRFYNQSIVDYFVNAFKEYGYSVQINTPYSGSIIPNRMYHSTENKKVASIMIEINKRLYLCGSLKTKTNNFNTLKTQLDVIFKNLNTFICNCIN